MIFIYGKPLNERIISVGKDYYVFDLKKDEINILYQDTMWVQHILGGFKPIGKTFKQKTR